MLKDYMPSNQPRHTSQSSPVKHFAVPRVTLHSKAPYVTFFAAVLTAFIAWLLDSSIRDWEVFRHWLAIIILSIGILTSIVVWFYEITDRINEAHESLYGDFVQQFDHKVTEPLRNHRDEIKAYLDESITRQKAHIDSMANCELLGESSSVMEAMFDSSKDAFRIRNTFVCYKLSQDDRGLTQAQIPQARERIVKFVQDHNDALAEWTDIVSQDVVHPPIDWLSICTRCTDLGADTPKRYHLRMLDANYPIVNFMILEFRNRPTEVIFGQGHHSTNPGGNVFRTRDPRIVKNFDSFWRELHDDSSSIHHPVDYIAKRPVTPAEIEGIWFRVSYKVPLDLATSAGYLSYESDLHDIALVKTKVDNRRIRVDGKIYQTDFKLKREFVSVTADLSQYNDEWRLWFSTRAQITGSRLVSGFYSFPSPDKLGKVDKFFGEYQSQSTQDQKTQIIGFRLSDRNFSNLNLGQDPREFPDHLYEILEEAQRWWLKDPKGQASARRPHITDSHETNQRRELQPSHKTASA